MSSKLLSIIFYPNDYSFCIIKDDKIMHSESSFSANNKLDSASTFENKVQKQLYFKQKYDRVEISVLSNQFNLVPLEIFKEDQDPQKWLEFNAELYENDPIIGENLKNIPAKFIYSFPHEVSTLVEKYFKTNEVKSANMLFINSIELESAEPQIFVNLHLDYVEILAFDNFEFKFYNLFQTRSKEDNVYYILQVMKQIGMDSNEVLLYYFGELEEEELKLLMTFVRHVMPGTEDVTRMNNYTILENLQ